MAPDVVDRLFECAAARPEHAAVIGSGRAVTYRDLAMRVRRFAAAFARTPAPKILIALPQCADAYAAMFAAGLAGGFYSPVNTQAPAEKLVRIVRQLQPDIIIGAPALARPLAEAAPGAIWLNPEALPALPLFEGRGTRHRLAYVIFTSGSTGEPKGVMIPRAALDHFVEWAIGAGFARPEDRVSQHPNIAFDLSVLDIYGALCSGASLVPVAGGSGRLLPARVVRQERITVWNSVPSVISLMMRAGGVTAAALGSVRLFNFCGEPLLREHLAAIFAACPEALVTNTYGPTEATISMTAITLTATKYEAACAGSVALGDVVPGMGLHLLGGPHADEGELVITGPQLAEGYWGDEARTAAAFRQVDVGNGLQRAYFTGDWAERRGGLLFFKERLDHQVKVRGFRVELDEVAAAIRRSGWLEACVFKRGDELAAVVESRQGMVLDEAALREALALHLERHAIPESIREALHLPRNDNDKIDRRAAAALFEALIAAEARLVNAGGVET